jgi:hypothetical protein
MTGTRCSRTFKRFQAFSFTYVWCQVHVSRVCYFWSKEIAYVEVSHRDSGDLLGIAAL